MFWQYLFYINGFLTIPRLPWLSTLIRMCIIGWLALIVFYTFYWNKFEGDISVGGFVGSTSFLLNCLVNFIIILEAIMKSKLFVKIRQLQQEIDELLKWQLKVNVPENMNGNYLPKSMSLIFLSQLIFDGIKIWIKCISEIYPVFWYLLPITISLRIRYIQIIVTIRAINSQTLVLRDVIWSTIKVNASRSVFCSNIWHPYDPKDYEKLNYMRLIYLRMWEVYMNFNHLYSWSLLTLLTSSFFDIICNCYWTLAAGNDIQLFQKHIMHGTTSLSLACLVYVLFHFADAIGNNSKIYKAAILFMYVGYWIFGISPFTNNYRIYQAFVMLWYCEIALLTYLDVIYDILGDRRSLNRLISTILYVAYMFGHLTVLIESCNMSQSRAILFKRLSNIRNDMETKLKETQNLAYSAVRLSKIVMGVLVLLGCCHGTIMWTTFKIKSRVNSLHWRSLQCYLALQFKTLELLTTLLQLNYHVIAIRQTINDMGERNLRRVYKFSNRKVLYVVVPCDEEEKDEQLLEFLKKFYNEIYATFQVYNKSYGWSLLISTAVYFVGFVCNIYWILLALLSQRRDYYNILQNAAHALMAFALLSILCWYADDCYYESRYIGSLISKLAKPLGNKNYSDLVTQFSLQTLHQRFNVTAKEFFCLNLNLLGGMIAAIVTYLVILLQFMFTEQSKIYIGCSTESESSLTTSNVTNTFEI